MHRRVDRQVMPLGTWQSGQDSVVDFVYHVIQGYQYGAFRQVIWVLALLDKVRVDFIQQTVVLRHDGAEPLRDAQLSVGVEGKLALSHLEKGLREPLGVLVISHQGHSHVLMQLELVPLRPEQRCLEAGVQLVSWDALWYDDNRTVTPPMSLSLPLMSLRVRLRASRAFLCAIVHSP